MRISKAAQALGMSPRMLRYRERLGLVPRGRADSWWRPRPDGADFTPVPPRSQPPNQPPSSTPGRPPGQPRPQARNHPRTHAGHRQYTEEDLHTIALAAQLEEKYDVTPLAVAFALRAFAEPAVGAAVRELGERLGRLPTPAARAAEIDKDRALRWLGRSGVLQPPRPRPR
ncbi:MerR family transcriptional regulator [Actinopolymorpha sp. NPDC004070]|uniref:MerR family transcriptional regulator n=1 Tax=Actinopolymorpha sp. NPDC004070 TaxID=3154548 RepID=UPI0033A4CE2B